MIEKLTLFSRYAENGASSRLRQWRWRKNLLSVAQSVEVTPFFSEAALRAFYVSNRHPVNETLRAWCRRIATLRSAPDYAIIEYEALPYFPAWLEKRFLRRTHFILDFDDDVWTKYEKIPFLRGKYDALIRAADGVTVANHALLEKVSRLHSNVLLLPTPIEIIAAPQEKFSRFTLAWIGSQTTRRQYLEPFAPVLRQLAKKLDFQLLVIADAPPELPGVRYRFEAWSEAGEALLGRCHIGIVPLADDAFARGKSAYKLIQYLGAGIPAVASGIGENRFVLRPGETGFFAETPDEWCRAIEKLAGDAALRETMGSIARHCGENFTRHALWEKYRDFLHRTFSIRDSECRGD